MTEINNRKTDYPIDPIFLERWSPRAFSAEPITEADLHTMLEAARWAPSSYNMQPWRFAYARRGAANWQAFLGLLIPHNQSWAKDAAALVVMISNTVMRPPGSDKDVPSATHSLDAGTASGFFALQAQKMGWHTHGMAGFDKERAFTDLKVPQGFAVEAVYAVGKIGDPATLPEVLKSREHPSDRLPLGNLVFEGSFSNLA